MTEHSIQLVLPGDLESVRRRLVSALERLDYVLLNSQPITARRKARKFGALSTNVLNYSTDLTIGLIPHGGQATKVTFLYQWKHTWGAIGDKPTLTREAEAIAALAASHSRSTSCLSCGQEGIAETRFCRQCGAPFPAVVPAELEVLRLTAAANAAGKAISFNILIGFLLLVTIGLGVIFHSKTQGFQWLSLVIGLIVWLMACSAGSRLMNVINARLERKEELLASDQYPSPFSEGSQEKMIGSVVDDNTSLLPQQDKSTAELVERD